jgi:hypothetical protein
MMMVEPLHRLTFALLHLACMRVIADTIPPRLAATALALYGTAGIGPRRCWRRWSPDRSTPPSARTVSGRWPCSAPPRFLSPRRSESRPSLTDSDVTGGVKPRSRPA